MLSDQLPAIYIDHAKLGAGDMAYNASIIKHDGKTLLAYRLHPKDRWNNRIHVATLDDTGRVLSDFALDLPEPTDRTNVEDPRLFIFRGQLWIGWTQAEYVASSRRWNCVQKYGRIEGQSVAEHYTPSYGRNHGQSKEKNWTFFDYEGRLMAVYKHAPHTVIELDGERVVNQWVNESAPWAWGYPSGGTSPIIHDGKLLTFFHSYEAHTVYPRKYFMGALTFDAHPPFALREISALPLLEATDKERVRPNGWNCLVVFPCGCIKMGDSFRISIGVNDLSIALVDVKELQLVKLGQEKKNTETMRIKLLTAVGISGHGREAGEILEVKTNIGRDLIARRRAVELPVMPEAISELISEEQEEAPARKTRTRKPQAE